MALKYEYEMPDGTTGDYWIISSANVVFPTKKVVDGEVITTIGEVEARLRLYKNKKSFKDGKQAMTEKILVIELKPNTKVKIKGLKKDVYLDALVKATSDQSPDDEPFFKDSEEV